MSKWTCLLWLVSCFFWTGTAAGEDGSAPRVVVSIKPIHSLVASLMAGVGTPELLLNGGASPHGYVLRPSEARALATADLVIWVGPELESFLHKPLVSLGAKTRSLTLLEAMQPHLLPLRNNTEDEDHHHHHAVGANDATRTDPHFWLDPVLAMELVRQVGTVLSELDPTHRAAYEANSRRLINRLETLDRDIRTFLAPVRDIPYLVFHDAYQYFEKAYQLHLVAAVTLNPERSPGAKRISEIRRKIQISGARCVFREPQFEPKLLAIITENTGIRTGVLDPLGANLATGPEAYFQLLQGLTNALVQGLSP
ncbi:MAG: zinc ABC transporter substrate-binding protein [Desulfuromonadaceae bacterium]